MTLENSPAPKEGQIMKVGHPSKLRVLLIALIFTAVMILGQTKRADAYNLDLSGLDTVVIVATVVAAVAIVALVIGIACSGTFGDCFTFDLNSNQTAPAGENEEEDEVWDQD